MGSNVIEALGDLRRGNFILVYDADGREEETDFFIAAEFLRPEHVRRMRQDGGGLIFLMVHDEICERFQLPFLTELYSDVEERFPALKALVPNDIPYDTKSSFSLSINHRKTFTGITDKDRALTMREFALMGKEGNGIGREEALDLLSARFRSPGHVPICRSSRMPLRDRFGHTELATAMALMAGLTPVMAGCEIMGENGKAKGKEETREYALRNGLKFLEGREIIEEWERWSG